MNILDEILSRLTAVEALLTGGAVPEPTTGKRKSKKAETQAEDVPALPGGLTITEVDVATPTAIPPAATEAPAAPVAPAAVADPHLVGQTIKTQLDMVAPAGTPNRALLGQFSGDWLNQQGLSQAQVTMDHVAPLVEYCKDRLNAHLSQVQQPATVGGY